MNSMLSRVRAVAESMATSPQPAHARTAIIDIGSNSVRLVVYDGPRRIPFTLFNEKVMAGLGASLAKTGAIEPEAMDRGLRAIGRFAHLCRAMKVTEIRCVATAAVRDATNGGEFIARAKDMGLTVELLTGAQEAIGAAMGVLSGIPNADGIVGDLGGGSLELARIRDGAVEQTISLPLGVLRLPQIRAKGPRMLERIVVKMLEKAGWTPEPDLPFYLVGGSWRALARFDMQLTSFPLPVVHQYEMTAARAEQLTRIVSHVDRTRLKQIPAMTGSRVPTLPDAAALLSVVVRQLKASRLVVSAYGLREGLLYEALPEDIRADDPLLVAAEAEGEAQARFRGHGDRIDKWIAPLFADDDAAARRIRRAACLLADVGWRANPDFRAERGVEIALHSNWVGITAPERAMLAQALHSHFGGGMSCPPGVELLAKPELLRRAALWGLAIRLAQRLSGGVEGPLAVSRLSRTEGHIELQLRDSDADLYGETVERRLRNLAQAMGVKYRLLR
ncbi:MULTISPECIES: Ppx/GppA family phosphatase [Sphingobium]|uniref:Exopolyphosphatase n=2 Tax=Sphingobium cupriresistens TaxID=1132417 RepID=A0A0J7XTX4_9SPHN|nr:MULTISPECIES: Ppx/GppA family phosphatase [Sphingobium]KMS54488.1 exopolyphosphatase [Sphingobium cupriresistens LL01]MBJ7378614.1 Ppx/GppA family phosphatase [Sphingobium sp.]RYM08145.1 Ppx/GppA family phosphatase [Sphingobium cupriresistens]WCP12929.1 Guanosine-5'-triphosphate,3'-diphosphate pyrophosphatase [Sphingobium sp. AntQ-1]